MGVLKVNYHFCIKSFLKGSDILVLLLSTIDILSIAFAFQCSYFINNYAKGGYFFSEKYLVDLLFAILPFWLLILYLIKFTQIPTKRFKALFILYIHSALVVLFLLILFCFIFNLLPVPLKLLIELSFLGYFFLFIERILEYKVFKNYGVKRHIYKKIAIIADDSSIFFIENIYSKKELGYKIVAIFTPSTAVKEKYENRIIILPEKYLGILTDLIEIDLIDEVLFLKGKTNSNEVREIVTTCEELGVTFRLRNSDLKILLTSAIKTTFANGNFLSFINIRYHSFKLAIRKTMDINMSLLIIVVLSPVFAIVSSLLKLSSRGPIICKQEGIGWKGRSIMLYRFRTYIEDTSLKSNYPENKNRINSQRTSIIEIPKVTKIGKFLIKSGLDQLPQLFNVLKGELSIYGIKPSFESGRYTKW